MMKTNNLKDIVFGAIIGDPYEFDKRKQFMLLNPDCGITDDTVMTVAAMKSLIDLHETGELTLETITDNYRFYGRRFYNKAFGPLFRHWLLAEDYNPIGSFGNGSAMRISPVGWFANSVDECVELAAKLTIVSHNHYQGIDGAVFTALAIFYARQGLSKKDIKAKLANKCSYYNLDRSLIEIKNSGYKFNATCLGSVPESFISFYESNDFVEAVSNAIYLKGDTDTMGCIAGSIAEAYYGTENIPEDIKEFVWFRIPEEYKAIILKFNEIIKERNGISD